MYGTGMWDTRKTRYGVGCNQREGGVPRSKRSRASCCGQGKAAEVLLCCTLSHTVGMSMTLHTRRTCQLIRHCGALGCVRGLDQLAAAPLGLRGVVGGSVAGAGGEGVQWGATLGV